MIIIPWKCQSCGATLKGSEKKCPECGATIRYICRQKGCGKELKDGKEAYCPMCKSKRQEKAKKHGKIGAGCVAFLAAAGKGAYELYKTTKKL